jgi:hypothetical protein
LWNNGPAGSDEGPISMEEREFYDEKQETKKTTLTCPHCRQSAEYDLSWMVRTKRRNLPPRADERDRARFAKARSYMVRREDLIGCKNVRCRPAAELLRVALLFGILVRSRSVPSAGLFFPFLHSTCSRRSCPW